jgi:hypothetical protein
MHATWHHNLWAVYASHCYERGTCLLAKMGMGSPLILFH